MHCICTLLYKAEKLSVRPSTFHPNFCVTLISAMAARIDIKLTQNESYVFWHQQVCFDKFLTSLVFRPQCFECASIEDFAEKFAYIPVKCSPDVIDNIY